MRKQIDKRIRLAGLAVGIVLLIGSAYAYYTYYQLPTTVERYVSTYSYEQTGAFDYTVYLLPNSLYDVPTLDAGETYFRKIVDYISVTFSYDFDGDKPAEISGVYEVIGHVKAGEMWERSFIITPKTVFSASRESTGFTVNFALNLTDYEEFVSTIEEETGVPAQEPELIVGCNVDIVVTTDSGKINESLAPTMIIPLKKSTFEITGEIAKQATDSLGYNELVLQQWVIDRRMVWLVTTSIVMLVLLPFFFLTKSRPAEEDRVQREITAARKRYRDRIVEADKIARPGVNKVISLSSLEALAKVADELAKPIIHTAPGSSRRSHTYYVFDESVRYEYLLTERNGTESAKETSSTEEVLD